MSHEVGTESAPAPATTPPGRRSFLKWLTFTISGVATALLAIPFVGYLFGALRKHQDEWVKLGPASRFPLNETRLHTFDNPLGTPWDAHGRSNGRLRAEPRRESIPGVRHELRTPGLPRDLVSPIGPLHVPLPRRSLLRRRRASLRPPDSRPLPMRLANPERPARDPGAPSCPLCRTLWRANPKFEFRNPKKREPEAASVDKEKGQRRTSPKSEKSRTRGGERGWRKGAAEI